MTYPSRRQLWNLLLLARPRLLPFVLLLPVLGFGWAHWDYAISLRGVWGLACVLVAWTLLQAGTLWLNAALDRDEGEVLLGKAVPVPAAAVPWAYGALLLAVGIAFVGAHRAGWAASICGILAILYSHPWTVWKGRPLLGPLVNLIGYGLLSPLAGWAVVGVSADPRTVVVWLLSGLAVLGCYFAAQSFQREEDRVRGYRTLVVTHGSRTTLLVARICIGCALLGGAILAMLGWLPRLLLVAAPLGWWVDHWLGRWSLQPDGGGEQWAHGLAWRLLLASGVCVALAYVAFILEVLADLPAAGLGTAGGHPPFAAE